jgi:hypothetical protein
MNEHYYSLAGSCQYGVQRKEQKLLADRAKEGLSSVLHTVASIAVTLLRILIFLLYSILHRMYRILTIHEQRFVLLSLAVKHITSTHPDIVRLQWSSPPQVPSIAPHTHLYSTITRFAAFYSMLAKIGTQQILQKEISVRGVFFELRV